MREMITVRPFLTVHDSLQRLEQLSPLPKQRARTSWLFIL
jgi:hypothetical protein